MHYTCQEDLSGPTKTYLNQLKTPVCSTYSLTSTHRTLECADDHTCGFRYVYTLIPVLDEHTKVLNVPL